MFSRYATSLLSNPRNQMSRFVNAISDLVKEECRTAMLHDDMTLSRLIGYDQSIKESKLKSITTNLKRSGPSEQNQPRIKNRDQTQGEPRYPKVKFEKGSGSQNGKPTSATYGKKHYEECLIGTANCFGCGKDGNKVRHCPTIDCRGKQGKKVTSSVPSNDAPKNNHFYVLRTKGSKSDDDEDMVSYSFFL